MYYYSTSSQLVFYFGYQFYFGAPLHLRFAGNLVLPTEESVGKCRFFFILITVLFVDLKINYHFELYNYNSQVLLKKGL